MKKTKELFHAFVIKPYLCMVKVVDYYLTDKREPSASGSRLPIVGPVNLLTYQRVRDIVNSHELLSTLST